MRLSEGHAARLTQRCPMAMNHYQRLAAYPDANGIPEFNRASGLMCCNQCGRVYYDHPPHPIFSFLHILCNGRIVKL